MKLFSTKEFAEAAGVSIRTLKRWRKAGKLVPAKIVQGDKFYSAEQLAGVTKYFRVTNFDTLEVTTKVTNSEVVTGDKINGAEKVVTFTKVVTLNQEIVTPSGVQTGEDVTLNQEIVTPSGVQTGEVVTPLVGGNITMQEKIQDLSALPQEILAQKRFFEVNPDKRPKIDGWNKPENQKLYSAVDGVAGFDTTGHGVAVDYLFLDFDHVLNAGEFVNDKVADFVKKLQSDFPHIYIEYSISKTGLHCLLKPTPDKFEKLSAADKATLYFSDTRSKDSPKLEIFFKSAGRYCLLTGNKYSDGSEIPVGDSVDNFLQNLLKEIEDNLPTDKKIDLPNIAPPNNSPSIAPVSSYNDPPEYIRDLSIKLLDNIHSAAQNDTDWLSIISSCKNCGVDYSTVDAWCKTDPDRYNETENKKRWDSLTDDSFGIENLIGKAPHVDISEFKKQWYKDHPQFDNKKFAQSDDSLKEKLREVQKKLAEFERVKTANIEKVKSNISFDKDTIRADDFVTAAAYCYLYDKDAYDKCKDNIKHSTKDAVIRYWEGLVKPKAERIKEHENELVTQRNSIQAKITNSKTFARHETTKNFNPTDLENYSVTDNGIYKLCGEKKSVEVIRTLLIISAKSKKFEDSTYKFDLQFLSDGNWEVIRSVGQEIFSDSRQIIKLAARGLPVTSNNAKEVVEYLYKFLAAFERNLPQYIITPRCGWYNFFDTDYFVDPRKKNTFVDGEREIEIVVDDSNTFAQSLKSVGSIDEWRRGVYEPIKNSPVARLMLAASCAPPMLYVLGERNFTVHIIAKKTSGKTSALLAANSVIGNPEKLIRSFDATKNGLIGAAAEVNDYLFPLDEKQSVDTAMDLVKLMYSLNNGVGRTKLKKDSKLMNLQDWRIVAVTTGETELFDGTQTGGADIRVLQIHAPGKILDSNICAEIRGIIKKNYGLVFQLVIEAILKNQEFLKTQYENLKKELFKEYEQYPEEYLRYILTIAFAGCMLDVALLGQDKLTDTFRDAGKLVGKILKLSLIKTRYEIDDFEREKDFIFGWIAEKSAHFAGSERFGADNNRLDIYGKITANYVFITTKAHRLACKEGGFDFAKVRDDFIENGLYIPDDKLRGDRKSTNKFVAQKICGTTTNCYRLPKKTIEGEQEGE